MKSIQKLSQNSARLLSSSNIITSVFSAVKELIENSIDGGATMVEVKLESYGLDRIEVRDNGSGIEKDDVSCVAKAHCTSKITSHFDLDQLETYGFRGEALNALCSMGTLSITTKTASDDFSQTYSFDKSGDIVSAKPSSSSCGTAVVVENLFKDLPVRKKYYKSEKCKKEELKKIEDLLCAYSCAHIATRFALYHNKCLVWQKSPSTNIKAVLIQILGNYIVTSMDHKTYESENGDVKISAFLPKITASVSSVTRSQSDRCFIIINKRPVTIKPIVKLIQEIYYESIKEKVSKCQFPIFLLDITIPSSSIDVNVDPNKTLVLMHNFDEFLNNLSEFLKDSFSEENINHPQAILNYNNNILPSLTLTLNSSISLHDLPTSKSSFNHANKGIENSNNLNSFFDKSNNQSSLQTTDNVVSRIKNLNDTSMHIEKQSYPSNILKSLNGKNNMPSDEIIIDQVKLPSKLNNSFSSINNEKLIKKQMPNLSITKSGKSLQEQKSQTVFSLDKETELLKCTKSSFEINNNQVIKPTEKCRKNNVKSDHFKQTSIENQSDPKNKTLVSGSGFNTNASKTNSAEKIQVKTVPEKLTPNTLQQKETNKVSKENFKEVAEPSISEKCNSINVLNINSTEDIRTDRSNNLNINVKDINWPQGKMTSTSGLTIQPVSILAPHSPKRKLTNLSTSPEMTKKKKIAKDTILKSPSPSVTGFEYFCHSTRLEVHASNPHCNNQEIARILNEQWKNLPQEKQTIFKELALKQYRKCIKPKTKLSNKLSQALSKLKESPENEIPNLIEFKPKAETKLQFTMQDLKSLDLQSAQNISLENSCHPLKALSSGIWLCLSDHKLILLSSYHIKEMLIYQRLLNTYQIKPDPLEKPINLNSELIINPECWETLLNLHSENTSFINHRSINSNGFNIKVVKYDTELSIMVVGISKCIPSYGIHDLQEILYTLKSKGPSLSLSEYRPLKAKNYLQIEAVRICRKSLPITQRQELFDLLRQSQNQLPNNTNKCFHGKPFQEVIFDLKSLT